MNEFDAQLQLLPYPNYFFKLLFLLAGQLTPRGTRLGNGTVIIK